MSIENLRKEIVRMWSNDKVLKNLMQAARDDVLTELAEVVAWHRAQGLAEKVKVWTEDLAASVVEKETALAEAQAVLADAVEVEKAALATRADVQATRPIDEREVYRTELEATDAMRERQRCEVDVNIASNELDTARKDTQAAMRILSLLVNLQRPEAPNLKVIFKHIS
jgi:hypothetical protein